MEHVEREGCHEGVAECILLIEVSGNGTRLLVPPGAPLIDQQSDMALGVFLVHDGLVLLDDLLDLQTLAEGPVVLVVVEVDGRAFRTVPACAGVVVETDALHAASDLLHQHLRPVVVVVGGTAGDAVEVVVTLVAQVSVELAELVAVVFGRHVAAAAPCLVADAEVLHVPGLVATVGTAQTGHRCVAVAGHVFHPLGHLLDGARADVAADVGLAAEHLTEVQELVGAERVVFDGAAPVVVAE